MNYNFGDVVLIEFPYTNSVGVKKRPALVLYDAGDPDVVVARITSQNVTTQNDIELMDWSSSGLLVTSMVRLHKVATLEKALISKILGHISDADKLPIIKHLKGAAVSL